MEASAVPRAAPTGVTGVASPQLLRLASDARLVALVRQGWPAAFEAVYNRHQRGILSFCRHVLSDADDAEDAVQHTFLAAYNDLIGSDKPIHLRAWLFTIARNRCYSILRTRREQPAADLAEPVTEGLATQVQRRQDLRDLVVDLRSLPDDQRAALVLAELDALSHDEIGQALGVPRDKVKALVFQARESLVASRTARETACADIREQLSNGRGGALRRANLRRHLRDCSGCRDFRRQVERQRRQLSVLLPVVPTLALKETVLTGTSSTGAGFSGGGLLASTALKSGVLKGFATLVLATAGTAGTYVATHAFHARTVSGTAARSQPQAPLPPAIVSTAGLRPIARRIAPVTPSVGHAAAAARPELRRLGGVRVTRVMTPPHASNGAQRPFGPLAHSRATLPRKSGARPRTIAPPASPGKAQSPLPTTPTPGTVVSASAAAVTPTTAAPYVGGEPKPASDPPPTGADAHVVSPGSTDHRGSADSAGDGTSRTGDGRGQVLGGSSDATRGSSSRTSGQPAASHYSPSGSSAGRTPVDRSGSSGSRSEPVDGTPPGATVNPGSTANPGASRGAATAGPITAPASAPARALAPAPALAPARALAPAPALAPARALAPAPLPASASAKSH